MVGRPQPKTAANLPPFAPPIRRSQPLVSSILDSGCRSHSPLHAPSGTLTVGWLPFLAQAPLFDVQNSNLTELEGRQNWEGVCNCAGAVPGSDAHSRVPVEHVECDSHHWGQSLMEYCALSKYYSLRTVSSRDKRSTDQIDREKQYLSQPTRSSCKAT
jgi:hypothetical protein